VKKNYEFIKKTAQFKALAVFSALVVLFVAGCNKEPDDDFGAGAFQYKLEKPTACPIAGEVAPGTAIRLYNAMDPDAAIYYTMDESDPTADTSERTLYSNGDKPVITGENGEVINIKAYSVKEGMGDSVVAEFAYTVNDNMAATPTASPDSGGVAPGTRVTLTTATEGAAIYYTTNGSEPTTASTPYSDGAKPEISVSPTTIKAIAVKAGKKNSAIAAFEYTFDYLTFSFVENAAGGAPVDGTVTPCYTTSGSSLEYSIDNGATWTAIASGETTASAQKILFRGSGRQGLFEEEDEKNNPWTIDTTGKTRVTGKINTVLDYENPPNALAGFAFCLMFSGCDTLIEAPELPAASLAEYCYDNMFAGCASLEKAPALPAETLAEYCYCMMFNGCTSLEKAPALPAKTLAEYCYAGIFLGCASLEEAPELPATSLAENCYSMMFYGCTSLKTAPALPAETLAESCYYDMFAGCALLETAPVLSATSLAGHCYSGMFAGCASLEEAPELSAETLAEYCYSSMFMYCTALETAPALPAETLTENCYSMMFKGCALLETAPALPAETLTENCYSEMFYDCTSLKTVPALPAETLAKNCCRNMFNGCTALETAPALPAETLAVYCYYDMFSGCISLVNAPELPATTLFEYCYHYMFKGCTSLINAPELPAETLVNNCYGGMFSGCSSLSLIKCNATDITASYCLSDWTNGVASSGTFYKNTSMNESNWTRGNNGIPSGWDVYDWH